MTPWRTGSPNGRALTSVMLPNSASRSSLVSPGKYSFNFPGMTPAHIAPAMLPPTPAPISVHSSTSAMTIATSECGTDACAATPAQIAANPPPMPCRICVHTSSASDPSGLRECTMSATPIRRMIRPETRSGCSGVSGERTAGGGETYLVPLGEAHRDARNDAEDRQPDSLCLAKVEHVRHRPEYNISVCPGGRTSEHAP